MIRPNALNGMAPPATGRKSGISGDPTIRGRVTRTSSGTDCASEDVIRQQPGSTSAVAPAIRLLVSLNPLFGRARLIGGVLVEGGHNAHQSDRE